MKPNNDEIVINAWAVEILDLEFGEGGGYRYADVLKSEAEAEKLAHELGGSVIPIEGFDWNDAETPFGV